MMMRMMMVTETETETERMEKATGKTRDGPFV